MAKGMVAFLRATLGFGPEIMKEGKNKGILSQVAGTGC